MHALSFNRNAVIFCLFTNAALQIMTLLLWTHVN
jgi:hypothetical protein